MKSFVKHIDRALAVLGAAAILCTAPGCSKTEGRSAVNFTVTTGAAGTKTLYGGNTPSGSQYLNWCNGDLFRVLMFPGTGTPVIADYVVNSHTESEGSSIATVTQASDGELLTWGSGTHLFYCLYPSPATQGMASTASLAAGEGTAVNASFVIPSEQELSWNGLTGAPDMRYACMYASASSPERAPGVRLDFRPRFSAFQVELAAGYYAGEGTGGARLTSFSLYAADGETAVSGAFSITGQQGGEQLSLSGPVQNAVTVPLPDIVLDDESDRLVLTVFTLARPMAGLYISFTGCFGGMETSVTKRMPLKDAQGNFLGFTPGRKFRIHNLSFADPHVVSGTGQDIVWDPSDMVVTAVGMGLIAWDANSWQVTGTGQGTTWDPYSWQVNGTGEGVTWANPDDWVVTGAGEGIVWTDDNWNLTATGAKITWVAENWNLTATGTGVTWDETEVPTAVTTGQGIIWDAD